MRVVNFTHGELYAFGAYMMYAFVMLLGVNFFVALILAVALGVVLGWLIEFSLLRKLRGADIDTTMLVTIGAWIALQNTEQLAWTGVAQSISNPFPEDPLIVGAISVSWNRLFVLVTALALIAGTYGLITFTKLGKAMRATFQDRETAALMGVDINRIYGATFALGSGLAAAAGALLGPVFVVQPSMGNLAASKAFAIVILGGLGSLPGAVIGGFVLAFAEEFGAPTFHRVIATRWAFCSSLRFCCSSRRVFSHRRCASDEQISGITGCFGLASLGWRRCHCGWTTSMCFTS